MRIGSLTRRHVVDDPAEISASAYLRMLPTTLGT
jgi:hypothetical protein